MTAKNIFLFLDYDGTLVPIADTPGKALFPRKSRELLYKLSRKPGYKVAVISGRSLKSVKRAVGLKNIYYAGNHGLELSGPGIGYRSFAGEYCRKTMNTLAVALKKSTAGMKGVLIEDKGLSLSVHYRLAGKKNTELLAAELYRLVYPYKKAGKAAVSHGKKVFDVRPAVSWNKGNAVLWFLDHFKRRSERGIICPVYIGDDATDEDAFMALANTGLTVRVGISGVRTHARCALKNTDEVLKLLEYMNKYE